MSIRDFIYQPPLAKLITVFEDNDLIIIDKPAGLLSVMGRLPEHQDSAYLRILKQHSQARVVHRLDMATSGLLIFAKHKEAERAMSQLFQTRKIKKYYIALVDGKIEPQGSVDVPLITDWVNRPKQKVDFEQGKSAHTNFLRLAFDEKKQRSRVQLEPVTGRSHQLRVHMQHLGHSILGDKLYHPNPYHFELPRMALHASYLEFTQPCSGQHIQLELTPCF